jgi:hypothetical protein
MHTLIWRDVRLKGWRPNEGDKTKVMECNFDTPLSWFVTYSSSYADTTKKEKNDIVLLKLMAHGRYLDGNGGYGVEFCKDDLSVLTLAQISGLRGKFAAGVELYACGAAAVTPGSGVDLGNGAIFCRRLAMTLATNVKASDTPQLYGMGTGPKNGIDFGKWQGNVFTWDKNGILIKKEIYPKD